MFSSIVIVIVSPLVKAVTLLVGVPPPSSPQGPSFSGAPNASWLIQQAGSSRVKWALAGAAAVMTTNKADTPATAIAARRPKAGPRGHSIAARRPEAGPRGKAVEEGKIALRNVIPRSCSAGHAASTEEALGARAAHAFRPCFQG